MAAYIWACHSSRMVQELTGVFIAHIWPLVASTKLSREAVSLPGLRNDRMLSFGVKNLFFWSNVQFSDDCRPYVSLKCGPRHSNQLFCREDHSSALK